MDATNEVLIFGLAGEKFAIEAGMVQEILDPVPVTLVPNSRPDVRGLINVRGKVVPLADFRVRFGMTVAPACIDTRVIVLEVPLGDETVTVGIIADRVHEVTHMSPDEIEEAPPVGLRLPPRFLRGIGKQGGNYIFVPDLVALLGRD